MGLDQGIFGLQHVMIGSKNFFLYENNHITRVFRGLSIAASTYILSLYLGIVEASISGQLMVVCPNFVHPALTFSFQVVSAFELCFMIFVACLQHLVHKPLTTELGQGVGS